MKRSGIVLLTSYAMAFGAAGHAAETLKEALAESKPLVDWRVRYESVEQTGFASEADALTSRLRAGIKTGALAGTSLLAEGVWIEDVLDDYDSTTNGETSYPVVADPAGFARINRFALINQSLDDVVLTLGRQRIVHDDARFVGNVAWRQNEQTFDGARAELALGKTSVDLTLANQVNRIFGPDAPSGKWEGDVLLTFATHAFDWGKLSAFGYLLDLDDAPALSSDTYGLKVAGAKPLGERLGVTYAAAVAYQSDRGRNPLDYDETYTLLEAGVTIGKVAVALGREVLGGDGTAAFQTPLATLHAFQGWADKFLSTPSAGIEDVYLRIGYALGAKGPFEALSVTAMLHEFSADAGSANYGDELDASLVARVARMTFTLKYAGYDADELLIDTDKLWLSMDYAF